jgi:hypothetical protein
VDHEQSLKTGYDDFRTGAAEAWLRLVWCEKDTSDVGFRRRIPEVSDLPLLA